MFNIPFVLYVEEYEGRLDTRQSKLNRMVELLLVVDDPNNEEEQKEICDSIGLPIDSITIDEWIYMRQEYKRRK